MDLEGTMLSEISQIRERQIPCDITYMWNINTNKQTKKQNK